MKQFIPSRELVTHLSYPIWWTPECSAQVKAKQEAWNHSRATPCPQLRLGALEATRRCTHYLRQAQAIRLATLTGKLSRGSMSDRELWSTLKQAGGSGRSTTKPTLVDTNGVRVTANFQKAERFGTFFSSKCSLGADDFPNHLLSDDLPPITPRTESRLTTVHFRMDTVRRELRRLNPMKATGC
eukprot:scpid91701/ scgid14834/ 